MSGSTHTLTRPPVLLSEILMASPVLAEHIAHTLGIGLSRGDHFRGLILEDKLCRFMARKEWVQQQISLLSEEERAEYRAALQALILDLAPPPLAEPLATRLLELGLAFRIECFEHPLIPLEFAFLSDAARTLQGSLAQAVMAYSAQGVMPRHPVRDVINYQKTSQSLAAHYCQVRRAWPSQVPALSLRQLLAVETLYLSASPQPAGRVAALLGTGSPEVFSWPRYMRYHGSGSHNPLQELLLLGLARPKDLDPTSALRELAICVEAQKPLEMVLPKLFRRYGRGFKPCHDSTLVRIPAPGNLGLDIHRMLVALALLPPPATKDETPSMIHVDRLSRLLGLPQPYQRFLLAIIWDCGWLGLCPSSSTIGPTRDALALMAQGPGALKRRAVESLCSLVSWDESRPFPCRLGAPGPMTHLVGRLRGYILDLLPSIAEWVPVSQLVGLLLELPGFRKLLASAPDLAPIAELLDMDARGPSSLLTSLATTVWWAQQADMAKDQAGVLYIRAAPPEQEPSSPPSAPLPLRVAANGEFFLSLFAPVDTLRQAAEFSEVLSVDQACRFRITRTSLARAAKKGWEAERVKHFLQADIPQNIVRLVHDVFSDRPT